MEAVNLLGTSWALSCALLGTPPRCEEYTPTLEPRRLIVHHGGTQGKIICEGATLTGVSGAPCLLHTLPYGCHQDDLRLLSSKASV